MKIQTLV